MNKRTYIEKNTEKLLNIVLIQPDIPQNTGNIARLAMAINAQLVLVRPLGFKLTDQNLLRAGMDYWKTLDPIILDDLDEFMLWGKSKRMFFLSAHSERCYAKVQFQRGDSLIFGSESQGLPKELFNWAKEKDLLITLPMVSEARCINVSSSAAAVAYEALNQILKWNG